MFALGATGNLPCATCESIEDASDWCETPNVSSASTATAATTITPGIAKRRIASARLVPASRPRRGFGRWLEVEPALRMTAHSPRPATPGGDQRPAALEQQKPPLMADQRQARQQAGAGDVQGGEGGRPRGEGESGGAPRVT